MFEALRLFCIAYALETKPESIAIACKRLVARRDLDAPFIRAVLVPFPRDECTLGAEGSDIALAINVLEQTVMCDRIA